MRLLRWVGYLALFGASVAGTWAFSDQSEKPGVIYVFGHNIDALWEIAVPLFVSGILSVACSVPLFESNDPP